MGFLEKIFGDLNAKEVKKIEKIADTIEQLDEETQTLSNEELRAKTDEFRKRLEEGETLDDILAEAFAVCSLDYNGYFAKVFKTPHWTNPIRIQEKY